MKLLRDVHARVLAAALAVVGGILLATAIPAPFSIDEASYVATITGLRDGGLAIAASDGLPPSPELLGFDANPRSRAVTSTPVASSSPPLYAPIALPFALGGEYGLIALQILSFLACGGLVFAFVRRETSRTDLAWLASGAYVLAGFSLEYAQGIWPQALAQLLAMAALDLASRVRRGGPVWLAAAAGACAGLAAGVRYQDAVLVFAIGAGLVLVAQRRRAVLLAFVLGSAVPLAASSAMNHVRYGSWNPISKGGAYLQVAGEGTETTGVVRQAVLSTYSRVVDYSTWPAASPGMAKDAGTGAITLGPGVKKALLQSAPWMIVPLLALLLAAVRRRRFEPEARRELLAIGAVVAAVLGMFALYGYRRYDGWCFNQRYLLELVPVLAAGLALAVARMPLSRRALGAGAGAACAVALALLRLDDGRLRALLVMRVPLVLAAGAAVGWIASLRGARPRLLGAALGAALGWAVAVHAGDDLPAARAFRAGNAERLAAVRRALPDGPALLFAYWGAKDPFGTLPLHRDVLVVDPWVDGGATARPIADLALANGRRVFLVMPMPGEVMTALGAGHHLVGARGSDLLELRP